MQPYILLLMLMCIRVICLPWVTVVVLMTNSGSLYYDIWEKHLDMVNTYLAPLAKQPSSKALHAKKTFFHG